MGSFVDCAPFVFQRRKDQKSDIDDDPAEIGNVEEEAEADEDNDEVVVVMNNEDDNGDSRDHQREVLD